MNWLKRYKTLQIEIKASLWYTICNIVQNGITFFTLPLFTSILSTEQYGVVSIYESWMNIIVIFATLNLQYGVFNNAMMKFKNERNAYVSSMQALTICLETFLFIIYFLSRKWWNKIFGLSTLLIIVMFLHMLFSSVIGFWMAKQRYEFKYRSVVCITITMAILNPLFGLLAVSNTENKGVARILSIAFVVLLFGLGIFIYNQVKGKKIYVKEYWNYALSFNIPLIPYYLSQIIFNQSDRIMIDHMIGTEKAGIYSVVYNCSMIIVVIINAVKNSFVPWIYGKLENKQYSDITKITDIFMIAISLMLFMVIAIGPEIIQIIAAPEYYEAIWVIPPVAASMFFLVITDYFNFILFFYEKTAYLVWATIGSAIVNIILNYLLIPKFGYIVAGYTTLISYILFAVGNYFFMLLTMKKKEINEPIYNIRFIIIYSCIFLCGTIGIILIYEKRVICWVIFFILVFMLLIFGRKSFGFLSLLKKNKESKESK